MPIQPANAADRLRGTGRFHVDATLDVVDHTAVFVEMDDPLGGIAEDVVTGPSFRASVSVPAGSGFRVPSRSESRP